MARAIPLLTLVLPALLTPPAIAREGPDLEEIVRRQGEEIHRLKEEVRSLREHDRTDLEEDIAAYLEKVEAEPEPAAERWVQLGGYFSLEFRDDGDDATMEFDQHRLVPRIDAKVAEGITFTMELEIEGGGAEVGFLSDNEILVEFAELRFEIVDGLLTFKAGALLVPWGRFNQYHDDPLNEFTDRPLVSRRLAAVAFDQPGVGVMGTAEVVEGGGWFLDYDLALTQGFDEGISTNGGLRGGRQSFREDNNDNKALFARLVLSIPTRHVDVLEVGASGTYGKWDDQNSLALWGYGLELFTKRGPVVLVAEYMNARIEQDPAAPAGEPRRMDGWYVEVRYDFFPDSWRGGHRLLTDESTFTLAVRLEGVDLNHSTTGSTFRDDLGRVSVGFNFRPVQRTVFKIGYTWVDSDEAGFESGSADRFTISWASYF